ncbi:phage nucleotide-binding protein [Enterococcus sp. 7E2_DIV0204]|uniref:AAA family ATPase n=1 Tax=unclassified Enterococcus TaxID=2608891 RepID=UPI000A352208|nr:MULTISPECIES: AAA family ATPase [unclassified Enterococcus]OTN86600.1 phage nucleotide-binding protein [Enterococcus sp. 7E2_DIV0204]OTP47611.1 phage nucleotide-binding protein [Enterococcus sp. 7D2_DIV0200]
MAKILKSENINRFDHWTSLVYSEPGKGKTSMVKSLTGRTILFSVDGMYHVLAKLKDIEIHVMDNKKPFDELGDFYRYLLKHSTEFDNVVIDNLSTFQKFWLNEKSTESKSGMPEIKDYGVIDRVLLDFIASLKSLGKNILIFAHEKKVEVTMESGRVYTQFQPDVRNLDAIMGIVPLVGRLVIINNQETQKEERVIVLQPTQTTRAKDQLIGNLQTINQMDLLPILQNTNEKEK